MTAGDIEVYGPYDIEPETGTADLNVIEGLQGNVVVADDITAVNVGNGKVIFYVVKAA